MERRLDERSYARRRVVPVQIGWVDPSKFVVFAVQ
jgi:hypothetical protein